MTTLSVVIPAYNEEDSIVAVMQRVLSARPALREQGVEGLELIVVDDGSRDRTRELVRAEPAARLLCHERNGGYGAALKTGFAAAQGEYVGFLDADGTYPPEHFPNLCRVALQENADIVIGSRMAGEASEMPAVRRLGNLIFASRWLQVPLYLGLERLLRNRWVFYSFLGVCLLLLVIFTYEWSHRRPVA